MTQMLMLCRFPNPQLDSHSEAVKGWVVGKGTGFQQFVPEQIRYLVHIISMHMSLFHSPNDKRDYPATALRLPFITHLLMRDKACLIR